MSRSRTIAAVALTASVALHLGTGGGLVYLSQSRVEQGGGDTPMELSLDPSAASGGSGPPIDAGPSGPPPQMAEAPPQQTVKSSEPPTEEPKQPPPEDKPQQEKPQQEKPQEAKPQEEKPQEAKPPPEEPKETTPSAESEPPPPVIKSAPDADTPDVVASEPPPPKPELPKPQPPKPKPPPPQQQAVVGGAAGGAPATGRERTRNVGAAIDPGAELSCAKAIRARLRKPLGLTPRPFKVQIVVAASGAVLSVRAMSSSGSPAVDQEAIRAFRSSGPFPPCPRIGGSIHLEVPVINSRR